MNLLLCQWYLCVVLLVIIVSVMGCLESVLERLVKMYE
jgi:hypothetical protein